MIRTRFAPSPTGKLHVGGARTALFNYLFTKHHDGINVLRIEDTDKNRSTKESEKKLIKQLKWMGLDWDEGPDIGGPYGPYRQSERTELYKEYAEKLVEMDAAYYCYCTDEELEEKREKAKKEGKPPIYDGHCRNLTDEQIEKYKDEGRKPVIRFKVDKNKKYSFSDNIHGNIEIEEGGVGDFVLLRSDGLPVYNFAVVIDDHLMKITHVLRGDDHLYNTLRQVMIYDTFGWERPNFAHLSMILAPDKSKLSKRAGVKNTYVKEFKEDGYLTEALINFLALLGWSPDGEREILSKEEMIQEFTLDRVSPSAAVFDVKKLKWMNGKYIRNIDDKKYYELIRPFVDEYYYYENEMKFKKAADLIRDSIDTLSDSKEELKGILKNKDGEYDLEYSKKIREKFDEYNGKEIIEEFLKLLKKRDEKYIDLREVYKELQNRVDAGGKALFRSLRIPVLGKEHGFDMVELFSSIEREEIIRRCENFIC
ncbi:MAG: glutamate--tRNA ligase [Candidatus Mcinerneyibacterium aminivorans]|uniref:Glutamate--tRNA ligase n=1 Tax=Candidatus Mcinerneyibacterium aminivorans TaxID=2703815 RepID=A0A5D0MLT3_9BACT|nr:MAG: glutamate--tRNA ligase [Candidatus Mcinerneyibacterium aminivorans]